MSRFFALSFVLLALLASAFCDDSSSSSESDSHHHRTCHPGNRARELVAALNEGRYDDLAKFYDKTAHRYLNGQLDHSTNGHPFTTERYTCLNSRIGKFEYHIGDIVTSGDTMAAVSGSFFVNRLMTGLASVYEFDPTTCKVVNERYFYGQEHDAYRTWLGGNCQCSQVLRDMGVCDLEDLPAPVDVSTRLDNCANAFASGDANYFSSCFEPGFRFTINGVPVDQDFSNVEVVRNILSTIIWDNVKVAQFAEGFTVVRVMRITERVISSGVQTSYSHYMTVTFNNNGKIISVDAVTDSEQADFNSAVATKTAPALYYWKDEGAIAAYGNFFVALLPVLPTEFSDHFQAPLNYAFWTVVRNSSNALCWGGVYLEDSSYTVIFPTSRTVSAEVWMTVNIPDSSLEAVHAISPTIHYDTLLHTLYSLANSPQEALVDFYAAVGVARGQFTVSHAQSSYSGWLIDVTDPVTYSRLLQQLCLWV